MSHTPRTPRAVAQRRALGRRIRAYRLALGLTNADVASHIGASKGQVWAAESATSDIVTGTLIDLAGAVGLEVALVPAYLLPLLDLTADELAEVIVAARIWQSTYGGPPRLAAALDKLTTTEEPTDV